jgi:hypothetical protein
MRLVGPFAFTALMAGLPFPLGGSLTEPVSLVLFGMALVLAARTLRRSKAGNTEC